MTWQQKYKENKELLSNYVAFLDECKDYDSRLKLCTEIARLQAQNKEIELMPYSRTEQDINDFFLKLPSNANINNH